MTQGQGTQELSSPNYVDVVGLGEEGSDSSMVVPHSQESVMK